ncbi:MAG: non-heme iron oxygenase ferredoxin subunit [Nitrospirae bacterium]|nr:non-heme iron oxygenase ferredoxin subunit [Nitrospirota bacterium]
MSPHESTRFIRAAGVADVPPGEVCRIEVEGSAIALFNVDGNFFALPDLCTHDEAPLSDGFLEGEEVECARHGARFHVPTGEVRGMPATQAVRTHPVEIRGEEIWIGVRIDGARG